MSHNTYYMFITVVFKLSKDLSSYDFAILNSMVGMLKSYSNGVYSLKVKREQLNSLMSRYSIGSFGLESYVICHPEGSKHTYYGNSLYALARAYYKKPWALGPIKRMNAKRMAQFEKKYVISK